MANLRQLYLKERNEDHLLSMNLGLILQCTDPTACQGARDHVLGGWIR
uniref:Gelsolin-like domain-containing protein n=1 Tax=Mesocestoides corti TaxID=53468 RepID=A0A5K3EZ58_MESCO